MLHPEYHLLSTIPILARQSHVSTLQHERNGMMAENVSRFGFSEMMNVLRDAVRQSREPASCLNAREVSKYIQNRYGFNNKKNTSGPSVPNIQYIEQTEPVQDKKKSRTSMSTVSIRRENSADQLVSKDNTLTAKSLPRHLSASTPRLDAKKTASGTSLNETPYDYYGIEDKPASMFNLTKSTPQAEYRWERSKSKGIQQQQLQQQQQQQLHQQQLLQQQQNLLKQQQELKQQHMQKEEEVKERNIKKQARRFIKNVSGSLIPEKSAFDLFEKDNNVQKLASLGMSRSIDTANWYPKKLDDSFFQKEEEVKEINKKKDAKLLEARKLAGLTRKGIVYSRLAAKQVAMRQAMATKGKKNDPKKEKISEMASLGMKAEPEPKTWIQLKALRDKDKAKLTRSRSFLETFPVKCETMVRRTREVRARIIEDLKLAEQRKQIDVLRMMARETLNKHLDDLKEQKRLATFPSFA